MVFKNDPDEFTVQHEFGHALGLKHEHQHPDRPTELILLNLPKNQTDLGQSAYYRNIERKFKKTKSFVGTTMDKYSVMAYRMAWSLTDTSRVKQKDFTYLSQIQILDYGSMEKKRRYDSALSLLDKMSIAILYPGKTVTYNGSQFQLNESSFHLIEKIHQQDVSFALENLLRYNTYLSFKYDLLIRYLDQLQVGFSIEHSIDCRPGHIKYTINDQKLSKCIYFTELYDEVMSVITPFSNFSTEEIVNGINDLFHNRGLDKIFVIEYANQPVSEMISLKYNDKIFISFYSKCHLFEVWFDLSLGEKVEDVLYWVDHSNH